MCTDEKNTYLYTYTTYTYIYINIHTCADVSELGAATYPVSQEDSCKWANDVDGTCDI